MSWRCNIVSVRCSVFVFSCLLQVLHSPVPFLLFIADKQREAVGTQFLFKRQSEATRNLITETLPLIKDGKAVFWLGAAGTGKSSSMNEMVVTMLKDLGSPNGPNVLLVRVDTVLYVFSIKMDKDNDKDKDKDKDK